MKICILLQHLSTMGGGEKHGGAIAECLSKIPTNQVTIICDKNVKIDQLQKRLNLDFSRIEIIETDDFSDGGLYHLTKDFECFINATYRSNFISKAPKNYLVIYFPELGTKLDILREIVLNFALWTVFKILLKDNILQVVGLYKSEMLNGYYTNWSTPNIQIELENSVKTLTILTYDNRVLDLRQSVLSIVDANKNDLDFEIIDNCQINVNLNNSKSVNINFRTRNAVNLYNYNFHSYSELFDSRDMGVCIKDIYTNNQSISKFFKIFFRLRFIRNLFRRLKNYRLNNINHRSIKNFYLKFDKLLLISNYSNQWLQKNYGISGNVLYPPIDTEVFIPLKKEKIILNVGRFFVSNHNKKQLELLKIFNSMLKEFPEKLQGWKFYAVGGSHKEIIHQDYLAQCKNLADNKNSFVIEDIAFPELLKLMGKASIYWHATGFMENVNKSPDRFEHFGITTVEAMSSGAVPVVINMAGQKETVMHEDCGFLWDTKEQLIEYTMKLIDEPKLMKEYSSKAIERAKYFSRKAFDKNCLELIT